MKKIISLIAVLALTVICLTACGEPQKSEYDEGYDAGFEKGYGAGYEEGQADGSVVEESAVEYVRERSDFLPEEAVAIIEAYQAGKPYWNDGSSPSQDDYLEAVGSLVYFCDYFFSREYN